MFKDYDKYLSASLKVYIFILIIVFIMKLVGLNYFGLDLDNQILIKISNYFGSNHLGDLYLFITIYIQFYFYLCIVCDKSKLYKWALLGAILNYIIQILLMHFSIMDWIYYLYSFSLMLILPMVVNKKIFVKKQIKMIVLLTLYQCISLVIRNTSIYYEHYGNFLIDSLLNIDQLLMLAITYNLYFMKGGLKVCGEEQVVDKDSLKYKICYDYYIERENAVFLGRKYSYTEAGIRQIASRINKQIKALN